MYLEATPFGLYCDSCGLLFVDTADRWYVLRCPKCGKDADQEEKLYHYLVNDGCAFCKKRHENWEPKNGPIVYDEKLGKVYCHSHCHNAFLGKCLIYNCSNISKTKIYLIAVDLNEREVELLLPIRICEEHKFRLPRKPNEAIWKTVKNISGHSDWDQSRGRIITKDD